MSRDAKGVDRHPDDRAAKFDEQRCCWSTHSNALHRYIRRSRRRVPQRFRSRYVLSRHIARLRVVYQSVRRGWKKKEEERRTVKLETQSPTSLAKIPQSLPFLSFACLLCSFLNIPYESSCNIPGNDSYRATYLAMTHTV